MIRKSKHEFSKVLPFFTDQERREYVNLKRRLDKIAELAEAKKVRQIILSKTVYNCSECVFFICERMHLTGSTTRRCGANGVF